MPVLYFLRLEGQPAKKPSMVRKPEGKPRVTYQIGAKKIARADIAPPELRDGLWARLTTMFKGFLEYQKKTTRIIPMVTLRPVS